jgi:hypothetical protein
MNTFFKIGIIIGCLTQTMCAQTFTINTIKGTFKVSQLQRKKEVFRAKDLKHDRVFRIPVSAVLNFTTDSGRVTIVNDSAVFSSRKVFNKPYAHLKQVTVKPNMGLVYNDQSPISGSTFMAILKHIPNPAIERPLTNIKRNRAIGSVLFISSAICGMAGVGSLFTGLSNSSGRNSYPQEKRQQAHFQTMLGLQLIAVGGVFSLSTVIIQVQNRKILRRDLVKMYNEQL